MAKAHEAELGKEAMGAHHAFHKAAVAAHTEAADGHDALCQECEKAISADDLRKSQALEPTLVSAVTPDRPRAIPRFGQREVPVTVAPGLSKIVGLDDLDFDSPEPSLRQQ